MRALLILLLALAPAVAEAQGVTSPYLALVWRYRAGDTAGAVLEAAKLPADGLRTRVLRDLSSHICETLGGSPDCDRVRERQHDLYRSRVAPLLRAALPAAFLLHLHVSSALAVAGDSRRADTHRELARVIAERMGSVEPDLAPEAASTLRAIRRRAMLLYAWLLQSDLRADEAADYIRDGLKAFPHDGELLLALGWVDETMARPMYLESRYAARNTQRATAGRSAWMERERTYRLGRAVESYRQALTAPNPPGEARARLGRTLTLLGRLEDARTVLGQVAKDSDARVRYLGALFSAGVEERANAPRAARRWYEAAIQTWPTSQAARVSLGRLLARDNDRAGAAALMTALPQDLAPLGSRADPWSWYQLGQAWRLEPEFIALRADLRQ